MKDLLSRSLTYFFNIRNQIAFYPTLLSLGGCILAFVMISLESNGISKYLLDYVPSLVINDVETSKTILSTFIGGLISIMVFSFSMVMILLNQASSNFSPRVLPDLISNHRHQIILGVFIGTILYCILILVSIEPQDKNYYPPGFAVLLSIIMMTSCLGAFIYFIHSISQAIQVNNIMAGIFETAGNRLQSLIDNQKGDQLKLTEDDTWHIYQSDQSGYIGAIALNQIAEIVNDAGTTIKIIPVKGAFVMEGGSLFGSEKKLDEDTVDRIKAHFLYGKGELIENNYILAFNQITEIAVKAMSPGINDPGTAINAIDYLTRLLALRMEKNDLFIIEENGKAVISVATTNFEEILYRAMASLRTYCKHDIIIVQKLLGMLNHLVNYPKCFDSKYKDYIKIEIQQLITDAKATIENDYDLKKIKG